MYNAKHIQKVRCGEWCTKCEKDLWGGPAVSVYDGYESSFYFCEKCMDEFDKLGLNLEEALTICYEEEDESDAGGSD